MIKFITVFFITGLTISNPLWAQQPKSALTIISENNELFYATINGIPYTTRPVKALKIEDINGSSCHIKIDYLNRRIPALEHRYLPITDINGRAQNITYALDPSKRGTDAFTVYQIIPQDPINIRPEEIAVFYLGNNRTPVPQRPNPNVGTNPVQLGPREQTQPSRIIANELNMQILVQTLGKESFDDNKILLIQNFTRNYYIKTTQAATILKELSFEKNKLDVAKSIFEKIIDPENYYTISSLFAHKSNKTEFINYINSKS